MHKSSTKISNQCKKQNNKESLVIEQVIDNATRQHTKQLRIKRNISKQKYLEDYTCTSKKHWRNLIHYKDLSGSHKLLHTNVNNTVNQAPMKKHAKILNG